MPFVLAFIGIMVLAIGARGRSSDASALLASEFTGPNSFVQWFLAIMIVGLIGFYKPVKPVADGFIGLVILSMVLVKANPKQPGGGFFAQLEAAFQNSPALPAQPVATSGTTSGATGAASATGSNASAAVPSSGGSALQDAFTGGNLFEFSSLGAELAAEPSYKY